MKRIIIWIFKQFIAYRTNPIKHRLKATELRLQQNQREIDQIQAHLDSLRKTEKAEWN